MGEIESRRASWRAVLPVVVVAALAPSLSRADSVRVRVMAANISSGNFQSYPSPGPGERIFRALQPDVVLIQEFNVGAGRGASNDAAAVDAWVDEVFGSDYHWSREPGNEQIPNGVISRWPIVESGEWHDSRAPNRDFAYARIDLPGDVDLWAVSVHFLTSMAFRRKGEAEDLVQAIADEPVPADDYLVIGGDFNTRNRRESALETLGAVVDILGPYPDDGVDPSDGDTNSGRSRPYDWVLVDGDLQALATPTVVGDLAFQNGLVFDTRVFDREELDEEFPPARVSDSGAPQMQHMAVVRDFLVPLRTTGGGPDRGWGEPIDLSGYRIEQSGGAASLTLPEGTVLEPGGVLVIGRSADRERFEEFWGELGPDIQYLNGVELGGDPGFPIINGGERFRILDAVGAAVDPEAGMLPATGLVPGRSFPRRSTGNEEFDVLSDPGSSATPGRVEGGIAGTGRVVLSEMSDAPGGGNWVFEFVELFYDAPNPDDD